MKRSNKTKCLIIDHDSQSNHQLELEMKKFPDTIELVGVHTDFRDGYNKVIKHRPDVIFLNISFPFFTGQEMLGNSAVGASKVIFLAKEANYLHQSIKASRFDCLLKPFVIPELRRTLKRIHENRNQRLIQYAAQKADDQTQFKYNKLALPIAKGSIFIEPREIIYCQADQEYTRLVTLYNSHLISKNLKYFETRLDSRRFFRVHKSFVLNLEHIEAYVKSEGGHVVMSDNKVIHIGRSRKKEFSILMGL
jgi:two-component system LytT family response regulator